MKRSRTTTYFTFIELILVMVISAFMTIAAAMFIVPITEMFLSVDQHTVQVVRVRKALSRLTKELSRGDDYTIINTNVVRINTSPTLTFSFEPTTKELSLIQGGQSHTLAEEIDAFTIERVNNGVFLTTHITITTTIGEQVTLVADIH